MTQFILIFVVFFPVMYLSYYLTEVKEPFEWLNYKPWICHLCLSFWTLIAIYIAAGLLGLNITMIGGIILAIMNAVAMWIDQKNNTIKI